MKGVTEILFPFGGRSDQRNRGDQPEGTTPEGRNCRVRNPITRRAQGAQRGALAKLLQDPAPVPVATAGEPCRHVAEIITAQKSVTYAAQTPKEDASVAVPSLGASKNVKTDRAGNVYALDGPAGVAVYNADMTLLAALPMPLVDKEDELRALYVDDVDNLYAGVSFGKDKKTARLFQYRRIEANKWEKAWEIGPLSEDGSTGYAEIDGFIMDAVAQEGLLYVLVSDSTRYVAEIVQFSSIDSASPVVEWRRPAHYPGNKLAIKPNGEVIATSESFALRGTDPLAPDFGPKVVAWTPKDLIGYQDRVHAWHDASVESSVVGPGITLKSGDEVLSWRDIGPSEERHLYASVDHRPPVWDKKAAAGLPGIRFDGLFQEAGGLIAYDQGHVMESGVNPSDKASAIDQQRTLIPGHVGSQFCIIMAIRPAKKVSDTPVARDALCVFHQPNTGSPAGGSTGGKYDHSLWVNRDSQEAFNTTALVAGRVSMYTATDAADPGLGPSDKLPSSGEQLPADGSFDNAVDVVIVTFLCDGGVDTGASTTKTRSVVRFNGTPQDRFTSLANLCKTEGGEAHRFTLGRHTHDDISSTGFFEGHILEMIVLREQTAPASDNERVLSHPAYPDVAWAAGSETEMEKIEGYMAHKWGAGFVLDDGATYQYLDPADLAGSPKTSPYAHPYRDAPPTTSATETQLTFTSPKAILSKYDPGGKLVWVLAEDEGLGYGVALNVAGDRVYCVGPSASSGWLRARRVADKGAEYSIFGADGAWITSFSNLQQLDHHMGIAVDAFGNLYVPSYGLGGTGAFGMRVLFGGGGSTLATWEQVSGDDLPSYAVALPQKIDEATGKLVPSNPEYTGGAPIVSMFAYVATATETYAGTDEQHTLFKVRGVSETVTNQNPRLRSIVAVAEGKLRVATLVNDTPTAWADPAGGGLFAEFAAEARFIDSCSFNGELILVDGKRVLVYRPKTDDVVELASTSPGSVPKGAEFVCNWGGRLALARFNGQDGGPQDWALSEKGDARKWDQSPPVQVVTQAISGVSSTARGVPDIVNAMFPLSDDLLVFGCDHSIWVLRGDPMAGGVFHQISSKIGMAYGRPYCQGSRGEWYFFGSRGGLYMMNPDGSIASWISEGSIQRDLEQVNFAGYRVELRYNDHADGIHVFLIPLDPATVASPTHHFFEQVAGRFAAWDDTLGHADLQIHASAVLDGDRQSDRLLVVGCADGQVRMWHPGAITDDTIPVDFSVVCGPMGPDDIGYEVMATGVRAVLQGDLGGLDFEWLASDSADSLGTVQTSGSFEPGANGWDMQRATGSYLWLRLKSAAPYAVALENLLGRFKLGARKRLKGVT